MGVSHLISIVGAGPGDPEMLTVKSLNRLKNADVILYDALITKSILDLGKSDSRKIYVGKMCNDGQNQVQRQNEIHAQFLIFSKQNKQIVRLKSGDPMIFGRGAEEIRFCKENKLNYEVIPGITSGIACSSLFDIPLTERGKNRMVLFYTGHQQNGRFTDLDCMVNIIKSGSPAVIYMGMNNLPLLATALINKKIEQTTSVNILSKISYSNQKSYSTFLGEVSEFLQQNNPESPSIIVIGKNALQI